MKIIEKAKIWFKEKRGKIGTATKEVHAKVTESETSNIYNLKKGLLSVRKDNTSSKQN